MNKNEIKLDAKKRSQEKTKQFKKDNFIPAVVYGPGFDSQSIAIKKNDFEKTYKESGESTLIDLCIENENPFKVLIQDIQKDPVKNTIRHVDFFKVDMKKEVYATVSLSFVGESKAVKEQSGILSKNIDQVEIKCLPSDLIDSIEVDISALESFDDVIKVADLKVPANVQITNSKDDAVASVTQPEAEIEEKPEAEESEEEKEGKTENENKEEKTEEKK